MSRRGRLKQLARETAGGSPADVAALSREDVTILAQELGVYQAELRRARDEAEAARQALALANEAAGIEAWAWDLAGEEPSSAEASARFAGTDFQAFLVSVHPEDRERVREALQQALLHSGDYAFEYRVGDRAGGSRWMEARGRVLQDETGRARRVVGIAMDTTRRKAQEAALSRAEAAELAIQARSEFMALASHELHTPLNVVLGFAELLLDEVEGPLNAGQRRALERVAASALTLKGVADAILELSRLRAGEATFTSREFDLRASLLEGLQGFSEKARRKGLTFTLAVEPGVPDELRGDAARLVQALEILVGNAVKFSASGGVQVAVSLRAALASQTCLSFSVRDTGPGIAADQQSRIFHAFEQVEPTATRSYGGIGLGLSVCSALVKEMGGTISVESEPGRGSTFRFTACFERAGGPSG